MFGLTEEEMKELGLSPAKASETDAEGSSYGLSPEEMAELGLDKKAPSEAPTASEDRTSKATFEGGVEAQAAPDMAKAEEAAKTPVQRPMATTYDSLYYGGPEGKKLKAREQVLRTQLSDEFAYEMYTPEEMKTMQEELDRIENIKEERYTKIEGEDVSDFGPLGKVINNPDGSMNYVPAPGVNEAVQLPLKFISDTARGILGIPELVGMPGAQDIIPKVSSENEAVVITAELAQLTFGGMAGVKGVQKLKNVSKYLPNLEKVLGWTMVRGTAGSAAGMAAVADEDVQTMFGYGTDSEDGITMAEAKYKVLVENLAMGMALKTAGSVAEGLGAISALRNLGRAAIATFQVITSKGDKLDDIVAQRLGKVLAESTDELTKATTQAEIDAAHAKLSAALDESLRQKTGMGTEEFLTRLGQQELPEGTYVPTIGEALNDNQMMRIYSGLRQGGAEKGKTKEILAQMLGSNQDERIDQIVEMGEGMYARMAPTGKRAAEEVRTLAAGEVGEQRAGIAAREQAMTEQVRTRAATAQEGVDARLAQEQQRIAQEEAQAIAQAEQRKAQGLETIEEQTARAQREAEQAAEGVQRTLEQSPLATNNLDALVAQIDETGTIKPISDKLRADLNTKNSLAAAVDNAYEAIPLDINDMDIVLNDMLSVPTGSNLTTPELQARAFQPLRKLINSINARLPEEGTEAASRIIQASGDPEILAKLKALQDEAEELFRGGNFDAWKAKVKQITDLQKKAGGGTTPAPTGSPVAPTTPGPRPAPAEGEDLPLLTVKDLLDVRRQISATGRHLKSQAMEAYDPTARFAAGDYLTRSGKVLEDRIQMLTEVSPEAQQARMEFDEFFQGEFSERWRTEMGKDWQGTIFDAGTEVDTTAAAESIMKVISNPNAPKSTLQQLGKIVEGLDEASRSQLGTALAPQVAANFSRSNSKLLLPDGDPVKTVEQARQLLRSLDSYEAGTARYWELLPESKALLTELRTSLTDIVGQARTAQTVAKETASTGKASASALERETREALGEVAATTRTATREAEQAAKTATREITTEQQLALKKVTENIRNAQRDLDNTASMRLMGVQDEPAAFFRRAISDPNRGFSDITELWTVAGKQGFPQANGITAAQQSVKEAVTEALLSSTVTPSARAMESGEVALKPLLNILEDGTVGNKIINKMYANDPAGKELIERLANVAASYRKQQLTRGTIGSQTAEKQAVQQAIQDLQRVIYGPLTQEARFANFITRVSLNMWGTDEKIARAWANVISTPKHSQQVIDHAAKLRSEALMPDDKAIGGAMLSALMVSLGYKEYENATDPYAMLAQHFGSYTQGAETEEAFSQ